MAYLFPEDAQDIRIAKKLATDAEVSRHNMNELLEYADGNTEVPSGLWPGSFEGDLLPIMDIIERDKSAYKRIIKEMGEGG